MASPLGKGLRSPSSPAVGHCQLSGMWAHAEAAVPAASEAALEHLKQGDFTPPVTHILVVITAVSTIIV